MDYKELALLVMTRQLAWAARARVPFHAALEAITAPDIAVSGPPTFLSLDKLPGFSMRKRGLAQHIIRKVARDLKVGIHLDEALHKRLGLYLPEHLAGSIQVGLQTDTLPAVLDAIERRTRSRRTLRNRLGSKLSFLIAAGFVLFVLSSSLLIFIAPKFARMFEEMSAGAPLPLATVLLVKAGDFFMQSFLLIVLAGLGLAIAWALIRRSEALVAAGEQIILLVPGGKRLVMRWRLADLCRSLATALSAGETLEDAANQLSMLARSPWLRKAGTSLAERLANGMPFTDAWLGLGIRPPMVNWLVHNGAISGEPARGFARAAEWLDERLSTRQSILAAMLPIVVTLLFGLFVMWIALATLAPMFYLIAYLAS